MHPVGTDETDLGLLITQRSTDQGTTPRFRSAVAADSMTTALAAAEQAGQFNDHLYPLPTRNNRQHPTPARTLEKYLSWSQGAFRHDRHCPVGASDNRWAAGLVDLPRSVCRMMSFHGQRCEAVLQSTTSLGPSAGSHLYGFRHMHSSSDQLRCFAYSTTFRLVDHLCCGDVCSYVACAA
jgi:hypothetical protein